MNCKFPTAASTLTLAILLLVSCGTSQGADLPIKLGSSREEVQKALGKPYLSPLLSSEELKYLRSKVGPVDWFPKSGLSVEYDDFENVAGINVSGVCSWQDWIPFESDVINGLSIRDTKSRAIGKSGEPVRIETGNEIVIQKYSIGEFRRTISKSNSGRLAHRLTEKTVLEIPFG